MRISYTLEKRAHSISIETSLHSDINHRLIDILENQNELKPDYRVMHQSLIDEIRIIIETLPHREARILKLYFGLDGERQHTLEEIGAMFKLTRERIRQIKEKSIGRLRHISRSSILRQYLE